MKDSDQFVVKVAGRCNIGCKYCYMYELGDESALAGPKVMSSEVLRATVSRIVSHVETYDLDAVTVAVHGGEPLLLGRSRFNAFAIALRDRLGDRLRLSVQTNGLLLNDAWLHCLGAAQAIVGVSLDGPSAAHDEWRVDHKGRGTYHQAAKGYQLLRDLGPSHGVRIGGIISVINPTQSGTGYYEWLKDLQVKNVNLLFPDSNIDSYAKYYPYSMADFVDFLSEVFDLWWNDDLRDRPTIQLFENIVNVILGGRSDSESIGIGEAPAIVIETNGEIQAHDVARVNHPYFGYNCNVLTHNIDVIRTNPVYQELNPSIFGQKRVPCEACRTCPAREICKGGFVLHRYSAERGYNNPSVYCEALFGIITHIYLRVAAEPSV